MASRAGPRAHGTDGSDFKNREKVAPHYNQGPIFKKRIKFLLTMHSLLWLIVFTKILPELLLRFGYKTRLFFNKWPFPRSELWEFMWCFGSIAPIIFGYSSLNRNRLTLMRITLIGVTCFGVFPIVWGIFNHAQEIFDYYHTRDFKYNVFGFPLIILLYVFFSICIQIHGFTLYFGLKLNEMWSHTKKR